MCPSSSVGERALPVSESDAAPKIELASDNTVDEDFQPLLDKNCLENGENLEEQPIPGEMRLEEAPKPVRMKNTDGLRAIGVMIVILYHMGYDISKNAWLCISYFFSFSGIVITSVTIERFERKGSVDVLHFWAMRISRLFPALFLTVIAVAISQTFRHDDGITFAREKTDLLYSITFLTNYNLVFGNKDDYFDDFAQPSITRHMWTLSIEEQYYIVWPIIIFAWTFVFGREAKANGKDPEKARPNSKYLLSPEMTTCFKALCVGECVVIAISYFSSWSTIEEMGMSAAYYSTWCRMGDIACGGLAYNIVRLHPGLSRRRARDPTLDPMTTVERIWWEALTFLSIVITVVIPMVQTPVEELLPIYFAWLRLPLSSLVCVCAFAGAFQLSEPLPRWAIFSRFLSWTPLNLLGYASYGIYLFHWPIIVWFGDPKGSSWQWHQSLAGEDVEISEFFYHFRNLMILVGTVVIGLVSFMFFEKPMVLMSKSSASPKKTIACGFASMAFSIFVVLWLTKDTTPEPTLMNDRQEVFALPSDDKKTPIFSALLLDNDRWKLKREILDDNTRNDNKKDKMWDLDKSYSLVREQSLSSDGSVSSVTIAVCKTLIDVSPCKDDWPEGYHWAWLNSTVLCGDLSEKKKNFQRNAVLAQAERCDTVLTISEITVEEKESHFLASLQMVLELDDALPGKLNQNTIARVRNTRNAITLGAEDREGWGNPIRISIMGESIAQNIGEKWANLPLQDAIVEGYDPFPRLSFYNLAYANHACISYFACQSRDPNYQLDECSDSVMLEAVPNEVLRTISTTKPNVVFLHDSQWTMERRIKDGKIRPFDTDFKKILAFNLMLQDSVSNGVNAFVYATFSASDANKGILPRRYPQELDMMMKTVEMLGCSKEDEDSLAFIVLDWARLTCPTLLTTGKCPHEAHGFDNVLPDGSHPNGDGSGEWLASTALAVIVAQISTLLPTEEYGDKYSTWEKALQNPITEQLLKLAPPDGDPRLEDIVSMFYLCPTEDLGGLELAVESTEFRRYKSYTDSPYHIPLQ